MTRSSTNQLCYFRELTTPLQMCTRLFVLHILQCSSVPCISSWLIFPILRVLFLSCLRVSPFSSSALNAEKLNTCGYVIELQFNIIIIILLLFFSFAAKRVILLMMCNVIQTQLKIKKTFKRIEYLILWYISGVIWHCR